MNQPPLGKIIEGDEQRDAIHIAIAPVTAAMKLFPGQDVGFVGDKVGRCDKPIGIVDPFLKSAVQPDQRFFVLLYPGTITSLRHDWAHPAFSRVVTGEDPYNNRGEPPADPVDQSKKAIEAIAKVLGLTYDAIMEAAKQWIDHGDRTIQSGSERWRDTFYGLMEEFWRHYEIVTGTKVEGYDNFFCCSC